MALSPPTPSPSIDALIEDLTRFRRFAFATTRWRDVLPTLAWFGEALRTREDENPTNLTQEGMREAAANIDAGGKLSTEAIQLFGLEHMYARSPLAERRRRAMDRDDILPDSYRRKHEGRLIEFLADEMLRLVAGQRSQQLADPE